MAKVIATQIGFYQRIREPGEEFEFPMSEDKIRKSKWLKLVNDNEAEGNDSEESSEPEAADAAVEAEAENEDDLEL